MRRDGRLSGVLHVLLHMAEKDTPATSDALAKAMDTNPVVVRRVMGGLRDQGLVRSEKGHGGGWTLNCDLSTITLRDIYAALGSPPLLAIGNRTEAPGCLVEQAVNAALNQAFRDAEDLLVSRLAGVTLAMLSADVGRQAPIKDEAAKDNLMNQTSNPFSDPEAVARYTEGPPRMVPGYVGMQRMTALLLAERIAENGQVLVLGAGGGLELKMIAEAHPKWFLIGIDPSIAMLKLAERVLGPLASRVTLKEGRIDDAPIGPFDGATCLLTMHFLPLEERRHTVAEVRRRLKPGSPFVVAHFSIPNGEGERALWLSRYVGFAVASGIEPEKAEAAARAAMDQKLPILTPEQDENILREAGFSNVSLFYAGFTFRGWVGYA